ncbi:hypothetical protein BKA64DRAFT_708094 [Cadophora sp. MPI-SDFR-AT-0126]|nr:hypothetical protein BKA64DRAFT_708094 [Leotiomycetes sp. MPI-SDFR-AT-0126]
MASNLFTTADSRVTSRHIIAEGLRKIEIYMTALCCMRNDYSTLIIEFDKDTDPTIKTKFTAVGLLSTDRILELEDKIMKLKKAITEREERVAKGKKFKPSIYNKELDSFFEVEDKFTGLRADMTRLRRDLESSEGYIYKKSDANFKFIKTHTGGGTVYPKQRVVEDERSTVITPPSITITSKGSNSIPSAVTTSATEAVAWFEASNTKPTSKGLMKEKQRKPSAIEQEVSEEVTTLRSKFLDSSASQVAQSAEEYIATGASKRSQTRTNAVPISVPNAKTTRSPQKIIQDALEPKGENIEWPLVDESVVAEILKRFAPPPGSKLQEEEVQHLKSKVEEQEAKFKEMGRYTQVLLKERDELRKDRQEAWDALKEERKLMRNMTERKNVYKGLLRGTKRRRDLGAEILSSDESDSEEGIPAQMKKRYCVS